MFLKIQLFFLILLSCNENILGARILGVFPPPAPSHYILGSRLMKELAVRGHQVTMISSFGEKQPMKNYKDIVLTGFEEMQEKRLTSFLKNITELTSASPIQQFLTMASIMQNTENALDHPKVKELLNSNEKFDLVIMQSVLNEAHTYFAEKFNCPLIVVSTKGSNLMLNNFVKNPEPSSYIANMLQGGTVNTNFWNRLTNFIITNIMEGIHLFYTIPNQNKILHTLYPDAPDINDIIRNKTALVLLNSHPSFGIAKPLLPNMIEIGGYHVEEPKALPKDLQEYCDAAENGFILFSMGSNLKSSMLPEQMKKDIMTVFAKLPYKILWKFEVDLPGKPDNVKISKWLPQNDILAHPNLKLFITHGGLLSTTEAVYHGVPIVGIPVFGDQKMNVGQSEKLGIGRTVHFTQLNADTLLSTIEEVLNNINYSKNARLRSKLLRDQPIRPIDNAMFWIEYVLRNGYCPHLRIAGMNMHWYQIRQIDVIAVLSLAVVLVFVIVKKIVTKICCCKHSSKKYSSEKKKKQ